MSVTKVEEAIYQSPSGYAVRANWSKKSLAVNFAFSRYSSAEDALTAARKYRDECKQIARMKKRLKQELIDKFDKSWDFPRPDLPEFKRIRSVSPPQG